MTLAEQLALAEREIAAALSGSLGEDKLINYMLLLVDQMAEREMIMAEGGIRSFETGATRDTADGKPRYCGYLSPLVLRSYGEYMLRHQRQSDGTMRDADNWKKGMPRREYLESLQRHFLDLWLHMEGYGHLARESEEDAHNAIIFNICGSLHEKLKEGVSK